MSTPGAPGLGGNPLFELQQTLYTSHNYTRRRLHRARLRWVSGAIGAYAQSAPLPRALEYGPGSGIYIPVLARYCREVIAADIQPAYLAGIEPLARDAGVTLTVDDIQDSQFETNSFGLVLCTEVLEHVPDPEGALRTLFRILRPGGIAIVTTPQRHSVMETCCKVALAPWLIWLVRRVYREPVLETGHISLRSYRAFCAALGAAGFEIVRQDRFGLYIPLLAEFGGEAGGRAIEAMETSLRDTFLEGLLWTQAFVLRKPVA